MKKLLIILLFIVGCAPTKPPLATFYIGMTEEEFNEQNKDKISNLVDCKGNIGGDAIELWGKCYSIEETTELYLWSNDLSGHIPSDIGNLTNLTRLHLNNNNLSGNIPPEIGNLKNLGYLDLSDNNLSGSIPLEIGNLNNLLHLHLGNNQLTDTIPIEICNLNNLIYCTLNNNQFCSYPTCIENYLGNQDTSNCP